MTAHLRQLALVFVGGMVGTIARYLLMKVTPETEIEPWIILLINVAGAMFIGTLMAFTTSITDITRAANMQALLGTGFAGGFTTYSALAYLAVYLNTFGGVAVAALYASATLLLGFFATWLGFALGNRGKHARK